MNPPQTVAALNNAVQELGKAIGAIKGAMDGDLHELYVSAAISALEHTDQARLYISEAGNGLQKTPPEAAHA